MGNLQDFLEASQARHTHLCPRQVLAVRMALAGLGSLGIDLNSKRRKTLLVISETDGCFVDGIEVTAQVSVGHRSLKIKDYGKIAATFINLKSGEAVRLYPTLRVRELAREYFPQEKTAYFAQLKAYQIIPDCELFRIEAVSLNQNIQQILGYAKKRTHCIECGEEIINGREVMNKHGILCMACAGDAYYQPEGEIVRIENSLAAND